MKKYLLTVLVIIILSNGINAQEESNSSSFVWGMRLGMNWSSIKSDFDEGLEARTSGVIGIFTRQKISNAFIVQPEINYTLKGASRRILDNLGNTIEFRLAFDYFEIPVLLKYNFNSTIEDRFKPEIFVGPFLAFRLSSTIGIDNVRDNEKTINDVKSNDYGLAFGTGMGFKIDNIDILLELRYSLSLSSFDNNIEQLDLKNGKFGVFSITTGFVIN